MMRELVTIGDQAWKIEETEFVSRNRGGSTVDCFMLRKRAGPRREVRRPVPGVPRRFDGRARDRRRRQHRDDCAARRAEEARRVRPRGRGRRVRPSSWRCDSSATSVRPLFGVDQGEPCADARDHGSRIRRRSARSRRRRCLAPVRRDQGLARSAAPAGAAGRVVHHRGLGGRLHAVPVGDHAP